MGVMGRGRTKWPMPRKNMRSENQGGNRNRGRLLGRRKKIGGWGKPPGIDRLVCHTQNDGKGFPVIV